MEYKIMPEIEAPKEVQDWLEVNKETENNTVIHTEQNTFVVITRGEKATGGYEIDVTAVEEVDEKILIKVKYIDPKPDDVIIQMITFPLIIIQFNKTNQEIQIEIEKD